MEIKEESIINQAYKYSNSIVDGLTKLEESIDKSLEDANKDKEFFDEQYAKDRAENAILALASRIEGKEIEALKEALKESIAGRVDYMRAEINLLNERDQALKESNRILDELNSKLEGRQNNRPVDFRGNGPVKMVQDTTELEKAGQNDLSVINSPGEFVNRNEGEMDKGKALIKTFKPNQSNMV